MDQDRCGDPAKSGIKTVISEQQTWYRDRAESRVSTAQGEGKRPVKCRRTAGDGGADGEEEDAELYNIHCISSSTIHSIFLVALLVYNNDLDSAYALRDILLKSNVNSLVMGKLPSPWFSPSQANLQKTCFKVYRLGTYYGHI